MNTINNTFNVLHYLDQLVLQELDILQDDSVPAGHLGDGALDAPEVGLVLHAELKVGDDHHVLPDHPLLVTQLVVDEPGLNNN